MRERLLNFARFKVKSLENRVMSPELLFVHQHPNILIALVSFHQIFKKKIYYSLDVLVSFPQG